VIGIEAGGVEDLVAALGNLDHRKAVAIEMAAQRREKFRGIDADHKPDLGARPGARRDGVDGIVGIAGGHGENLEAAPREHLFGERQARLAPAEIDRGLARPGAHLAVGEGAPDRGGDVVGHEFRDTYLPGRPDDGRERVDELHRGIGEQAAPIAGMLTALAGVDPESIG